jgi:hypothetical protein
MIVLDEGKHIAAEIETRILAALKAGESIRQSLEIIARCTP